ncbi:hypothetical protein Pyn_19923 [Prunus yedoensis var. nudiflora]|uniref:Uncharacterized protein n=1 Tax=Prunus yedoensis var. nudiflora TaxID=2094558 RepID=A0A314Z3E2_PRUYE|nr:hypothetical protein Pyn_19923 [Prunus yedoensis var. nudiflora]
MQNTYFSSSMYSVRTQGSLSYSFNDYSYLLNERFDRNPIHSSTLSSPKSCCCSCCAFSTHRVPINPCYLYGLRQSTLLQWSACRRLILGGRDRYNYRVQEQSPDWGCYEFPSSLMEGSVYSRRGRRRKGRCCCMADGEGKGELYNTGDLDDAEAMLSLLSEEVGEECFRRERNGFSFKIVELEGRRRLSGRERNVSEEYRKLRDDSDGNGEITRQTNTAVEGGVMWDWRKKTEKKLTEVVAEETQADWKSSEMHSRVMKTKQHELGKASGSHKQFDDEQETSYLTKGAKEQYSQTENQVGGVPDSRRKFQEHNELSEIRRNAVETTSWSQMRPTQRENLGIAKNLVQETKDEHYKTAGNINQKEDLNRDNQKLSRVSQLRVADAKGHPIGRGSLIQGGFTRKKTQMCC